MTDHLEYLAEDVLKIDGAFLLEHETFKQKVSEALESRACHVVIDLENVQEINSVCIGCIISVYKKAMLCKKKLCLIHVNSYVEEVFQLCRLDSLLAIFSSQKDALRFFEAG